MELYSLTGVYSNTVYTDYHFLHGVFLSKEEANGFGDMLRKQSEACAETAHGRYAYHEVEKVILDEFIH